MNNGKVRIYELSKELNLDNRDILAVCDQLNIAVKSHSSTITEAEAAQIRSAAEKHTTSHSSANKPNSSAQYNGGSQARKSGVQPPVKKQQILEIRRHRPLAAPPKRAEAEADAPISDPSSFDDVAAPPVSSPARPVNRLAGPPSRPQRSQPDSPETVETAAVVEEAEVEEDLRDRISEEVEVPESSELSIFAEPIDDVVISLEEEEVPDLIAPPSRPAAKVASPPQSNLTNRPTLKRARTDQPEVRSSDSARPELRAPSERGERVALRGDRGRQIPITETEEQAAPKPKPVIELRRKPVRPGAPGSSDGADGTETAKTGTEPVAGPLDELRRPTLPRVPKRTKGWEEEEEEQETPKAAKATKAKRRAQPVLDEDEEELEDVLNADDEDSPIQVSLSLARPPKPKGRPGQVKPVAVSSPTQKSKGRESSRSYRRDRREEAKVERPEHLILTGSLTVHDLAEELVVPETEIIKALFFKGIIANINQILDIPTATMVAEEMGVTVETAEAEAEAKKVTEMIDATDLESLQRRPPVVTIMGHVDHGKTTLLDSIRKTKVAQGEAGGITQHIGAYHVDVEHEGNTQQVVFLDTPGHEAFTAMRARGARVTDIAVLVVAADDGVRPQTIEAISHAKAAEVPIVVAINKVDKEEAQPDRVKQELTEFGLVPEEWGGETIMVPVSAINGENLDTLLEMLLLVSEVEDLYANPDRPARGTIIEANLDKARGPVATLLIQNGTLKVGDVLVAGSAFGKVRAMIDDRGKRVDSASPSFAVEVLGLSDVPAAGDEFEVFLDEKEARSTASSRTDQQRQSRLQQAMASRRVSLNTLSAKAQEGDLKELNLVLKADVQGSVEAILGALQQLPQKEVQVRVLLSAPGEITETDVDLAAASDAVIVGFNTTLASGSRQAADRAGVDVREYNIIYKLLEDIQGAMEGLLEPEMVEEPLGQVEVRAVFPVGRGAVAGCYVQSGKAIRNCKVRVRRSGSVVFEGNLDSLKRMKDDAKEVNAGYECGIGIDNFNAWEVGDIIETYRLISKRRSLSV
ncbi:translation initiation factor IF-2 [Leptolyngbya sp. FACHB-671]|uniref:translation initiation factor IF-2 n=1 Tax=Leptolyngbya sp. FACHB-671 TaxID=2692812 RepID=UPI00168543D4|nr:translation initiation factor IF-2 [Leptolyngbya sp. FACHB-671]MBD2067132.1 translation initiation factor IF-2 [Leptolyngbya sp. FACHB-671]